MLAPIPGSAGLSPRHKYPSTGKLHRSTNCWQARSRGQILSQPTALLHHSDRLEAPRSSIKSQDTLHCWRSANKTQVYTNRLEKKGTDPSPILSVALHWCEGIWCQQSCFYGGRLKGKAGAALLFPPALQLPPQGARLGDFQIN